MQILVVNDDGPPSGVSPYFLPFVEALQSHGHGTHVVIPDKPLSWIGKAHAFGKSLTARHVCPSTYTQSQKCSADDQPECIKHSWTVLDGSPASCTQIGLFHSEWLAEDIDLVVSGPNHGRNASTIYNLSSGTVGGALEGALCGKRSISLSFGSKDPQPEAIVGAACDRAVSLIEMLYRRWDPEVELYNINIPMIETIDKCPAVFTVPCPTYWSRGSLFAEDKSSSNSFERQFRWAPELSEIQQAAKRSSEGEDLWPSQNGVIS
ncbi:putative tubulin--tyrosine ligase pby1 [Saxophila tyrrhenica]|uniref:Tubulin--tyrosine ligase pby1 n=1 Tax=Saxophila tyrrhenica TaxID=1690608 RepID=A0AAV9PMI4_9PEZI|nr:putative tubulin--tyrosine ligase pby1 [Saxophila tyrrhenica]